MSKATCIVGLPGSGKTTLANILKQENPNIVVFDDVMRSETITSIKDTLDQGIDCVIADVTFIYPMIRNSAILLLGNHQVEWVFFENDPDKCRKNVALRYEKGDRRRVESTIKISTKHYEIPDDADVREIWSKQ